MRIECPECRFSAEVVAARIPAHGQARCPKCGARFAVAAPPPPAPAPADRAPAPPVEALPAAGPAAFGAGRSEVLAWLRDGRLAAADLPQAAAISGFLPDAAAWRRFLDAFALWCGAIFLALAVIFFFAYNWAALGRYGRFALVEVPLVLAVVAAWRLSLERHSGRAALLVATLLVGALLALVGQTYQTGADPWELFATWALLVLPWVILARFVPLWLLWLALLNLATGFYYQVTSGRLIGGLLGALFSPEGIWWSLLFLNTLALAAWELAARRWDWLAPRWAARCVATLGFAFVTAVALWGIFDDDSTGLLNGVVYLGWLGAGYAVYRYRLRDLYCLSLGVLSLIVVITALLSRHLLDHGEAGIFFLLGNLVVGMSALGGWWLRSVAREVNE